MIGPSACASIAMSSKWSVAASEASSGLRQISIGSGPAQNAEQRCAGRDRGASDRVVRRKRLRGDLAATSYGF
jgi:hypothetical protein